MAPRSEEELSRRAIVQIAVLGMGKMGRAVAGRLIAGGHDVAIWNRSPDKAKDLVAQGAKEAGSATEAARGAEVVITSLADDAAVLAVVNGDSGVAVALGVEATFVDMSTVSPETAVTISDLLGGRSLASPILGAPSAVESGQAVYLASGSKERFEQLSPVFSSLSEHVRYLSEDVRRAPQLKLLANYLLLSGIAVLAEMIATAQAVGLAEDVMREFLDASPLVAPALRNRLDALVAADHAGWFSTTLGAKDVGLAEDLAMREGLRLPIAEVVKQRYEEAAASGYADADVTAVIELMRPSKD
jgi:3-hydroxyisobutyrate dehydrogenase-like beta-hydroxyacid dehydrogenase